MYILHHNIGGDEGGWMNGWDDGAYWAADSYRAVFGLPALILFLGKTVDGVDGEGGAF